MASEQEKYKTSGHVDNFKVKWTGPTEESQANKRFLAEIEAKNLAFLELNKDILCQKKEWYERLLPSRLTKR